MVQFVPYAFVAALSTSPIFAAPINASRPQAARRYALKPHSHGHSQGVNTFMDIIARISNPGRPEIKEFLQVELLEDSLEAYGCDLEDEFEARDPKGTGGGTAPSSVKRPVGKRDLFDDLNAREPGSGANIKKPSGAEPAKKPIKKREVICDELD
ncbi:hypothetical protein CPB83DRAFT_834009 [Crepidotus variabilis]|uniref:Uncharacterized protein n=1 Tax=Crepidotus variabilis TaxID=179855 RepID=A0A9P6ELE4_9AGAR|nr:hypothetical protein CPB83DRAFT_834009 [Crepidotus variabilis]